MLDVRACAACLATDVRLHSMRSGGLLQGFRLLCGRQPDVMPLMLCWECAALVNKVNKFRHKCERAILLLQDVFNTHNKVTESLIHTIDRVQNKLCSNITVSELDVISVNSSNVRIPSGEKVHSEDQPVIKFEKVELEESDIGKPEFVIKSEDENDFEVPLSDLTVDCLNKRTIYEDGIRIKPNRLLKERKNSTRRKKQNKCDKAQCKKSADDFKAKEIFLTPEEARNIYSLRKKSKEFKKAHLKCMICFRAHRNEKSYEKHLMRHDPSQGEFECDACMMRFNGRDSIRKHISIHHTKKYICNICGKVSYTREIAKHHFRVHERGGRVARRRKKMRKQLKVTKAEEFGTTEVILTQEQMMAVVQERRNSEPYTAARFKCTLCYKGFNEQKPFRNHVRQHDPVSGPLQCDVCNIRLASRRKLYKHISCNHMKKYSCNTCPHVCYNRASALKHYAWHRGVVYTCHICGATTRRMSTHLSHVRIKHPSQHICGDCGESFVSPMGLYHHTKKMHSVGVAPDRARTPGPYCAACDVQFTSAAAWTRHVLISPKHAHEKQVLNGCRECGESFASAGELKRHHRAQHRRSRRYESGADKQFPAKCAQCEELMPSASLYWQHFRQRHPGKDFPLTRSSFICEYCGNWFKHKSTLDIHAQSHLDIAKRTHPCDECPKRFVRAESLAAHARWHAAGGRFACDVCGRQFSYKHSLTNHFRTHTAEKPHPCAWCGKTFAYESNLKKHELESHYGAPATSGSHLESSST